MAYDNITLNTIYDKTNGYCHICHKKLSFSNYGIHGAKASWHVDHSNPKAKGGSNYVRNLLPACIPCNLAKGKKSTRTARSWSGNTRAPLSHKRKQQLKAENAAGGAAVGALLGLVGGPAGVAVGAILGGIIGSEQSPRK